MYSFDECGNDVRSRGFKVVARSIQIDLEKVDGNKPVLLPIRLRLHDMYFFCQSVGSIGFFGVTIPKAFFLKRCRGEFWITAYGANIDEFFNTGLACRFD